MLPSTFILQIALLTASVSAAQTCSTSTVKSCSTQMGIAPAWWVVNTFTRTSIPAAITLTTTPTVIATTTVPAVPLTATVSSTVIATSTTTATPQTDTTYLTSTMYATTAVTTTSTTTGVITTTVTSTAMAIQTSIIPIPTGFIDVYGSSGDSNYAGTKRAIDRRRDFSARVEHDKRTYLSNWLNSLLQGTQANKGFSTTKKSIALKQFNNPILVNCVVNLQRYCNKDGIKAVTTTVTSTSAPTTTTSTISTTITSTTTIIPPTVTVSVYTSTTTSTLTQITTMIAGATSTASSTLVTTVSTTTSVYAACGTSNLLGSRISNGNAISKTYFYDDKAVVVTSQQTSAYDCCVACQTSSFCQFFQYSGSTGQCYVTGQDAAWCPNNQQDAGWPTYFVYNDPAKVSDALVVGNGICGITMDLGQDNGS